MSDRLLTASQVCERLSVSRPTLNNIRRSDKTFPAPVMLGSHKLRWRATDIDIWISRTTRVEGDEDEKTS